MSLTPEELLGLQLQIEPHLIRIEKLFVSGIKLTLICRLPGNDEADVLLTQDDLGEAAKVIERRKAQSPTNAPFVPSRHHNRPR